MYHIGIRCLETSDSEGNPIALIPIYSGPFAACSYGWNTANVQKNSALQPGRIDPNIEEACTRLRAAKPPCFQPEYLSTAKTEGKPFGHLRVRLLAGHPK